MQRATLKTDLSQQSNGHRMSELDIFERVYAKCREEFDLSPAESRQVAAIVADVEGPGVNEEPTDQATAGDTED